MKNTDNSRHSRYDRDQNNNSNNSKSNKSKNTQTRWESVLMTILVSVLALVILFLGISLAMLYMTGTSPLSRLQERMSSLYEQLHTEAAMDAASDSSAAASGEAAGPAEAVTDQADGSISAEAVSETAAQTETAPATEAETLPSEVSAVLTQADRLAAGYDYDAAIALVRGIDGYEQYDALTAAVASYEETKNACVAVDVYQVPHFFFHSLINDTDRAFDSDVLAGYELNGMNAWMTTVSEFDKIINYLYENNYVLVRLRDLVVETADENGEVHFETNTSLMLPEGKKAFVLSVDDLSYYHTYTKAGFPEKLVLDENGDVKCLYTDGEGTTSTGDYDVVPRLSTFLEEHPDFSYQGARGLIAMTGYNGVFGYRTDEDYVRKENLSEEQEAWLEAHPDFDINEEISEATKIADALKEEGWEFASHTWGHLSVTSRTLDELKEDNEKWVKNVQDIVGEVDTIIFAHGNDIGAWIDGYTEENETYVYFRDAGYRFFCNVDASAPYLLQVSSEYVRQSRINLDGLRLYEAITGESTILENFFTYDQIYDIFDGRRPTPVTATGE